MKGEKKLYKKSVILCLIAVLFIVVLTSFSYAFYFYSAEGNLDNTISSCSIDMEFTDQNAVGLVSAYPIDDSEVDNYEPYVVSVNNNSKCSQIYYYLNMVNYCNVCAKEGDICYLGEKQINCSDDYLIDPQYIRYKVTNLTTGKTVIGSNPEVMSIEDSFSTNGKNTYEIRLWISNKATNEDLYVYDENGDILEAEDGKYITKNYVSRLDTEVSTDRENDNVAIIEDKNLILQEDGSYSNVYDLAHYYINKINVIKYAWKEKTQYEITFTAKCPEQTGALYLRAFYSDGTSHNISKVVCDNNYNVSITELSTANKTIDSIGIGYDVSTSANTVFIKDVIVKEVR